MQREQERGFRRDGSDQGVSPCDIPRNIMPTPGADAVAELPQLSPECNNSNGVGRIGVALERQSGDLGGGPIRKNREFTMRTSQPDRKSVVEGKSGSARVEHGGPHD